MSREEVAVLTTPEGVQAIIDKLCAHADGLKTQNESLRTELEQVKADNGALRQAAGDMSRVDQAGVISPEEYQTALQNLERVLSQPHPGDSLRTRIATLEGALDEACRKCYRNDGNVPCKRNLIPECIVKQALHGGKEEAR